MPDVVEDGGLKRTPRSQTAVLIGDSDSACVVRSMVCKSKFLSLQCPILKYYERLTS